MNPITLVTAVVQLLVDENWRIDSGVTPRQVSTEKNGGLQKDGDGGYTRKEGCGIWIAGCAPWTGKRSGGNGSGTETQAGLLAGEGRRGDQGEVADLILIAIGKHAGHATATLGAHARGGDGRRMARDSRLLRNASPMQGLVAALTAAVAVAQPGRNAPHRFTDKEKQEEDYDQMFAWS
jgi:hypothetical protein